MLKKILGFVLRDKFGGRNDDMDKKNGILAHYLGIKCLYTSEINRWAKQYILYECDS